MPKPRNPFPPVEKKLSLPPMLVGEVEAELFSELEGRVPYGAWSKLVVDLIEERKLMTARRAAFTDRLQAVIVQSLGDSEMAHREADLVLQAELEALGYDLSAFKTLGKHYA